MYEQVESKYLSNLVETEYAEDARRKLKDLLRFNRFSGKTEAPIVHLKELLYIGPEYGFEFYQFLHRHKGINYSNLKEKAADDREKLSTKGKSPSPEMFFENCPCGGDL